MYGGAVGEVVAERRPPPAGRHDRAARARLAHALGRAGPGGRGRRPRAGAAAALPRRARHARDDRVGRAVRHRRGPARRDGVGVGGVRRGRQPGRPARQPAGCRVVGSAGGADKCRYVVEELGFDACVDHRAGDLEGQLREVLPDGLDVYFDNVGGEHLRAALALANPFARLVECGMISAYNGLTEPVDNLGPHRRQEAHRPRLHRVGLGAPPAGVPQHVAGAAARGQGALRRDGRRRHRAAARRAARAAARRRHSGKLVVDVRGD